MRNKLLVFILSLAVAGISIAAAQSYATRIFPVTADPVTCKENSIFYNMTTHQFLVCTSANTLSSVSFGGGGGGVGITFLNGLTGSTQIFATGSSGTNFNIVSSGSTHTFNLPSANGVNRGLLTAADWSTFNNKQSALGYTAENLANKDAANGYAGLSLGKIAASELQEVIGIADLTDYASTSGTGTTAIKATFTSLTTNDCLLWNGTDWINSNICTGGGVGGITTLNTLVAATQTFAVGTSGTDFTISSASSTHTFNLPSSSASNRGLLTSTDWSTFNGKQNALGFTAENSANKNATNGYAGLSSGKIAAAQIQEVINIADLADFSGKSGNGTTALGATISSPTVNQCLIWDGAKWVNSSTCGSGSGDMILASIQTVTGAKTFDAGKLIVGTSASAPTVVANSFYRNTGDSKLYVGSSSGASWNEIFEAGVSGPVSVSNGGRGTSFGTSVTSAATIAITGEIFHVTGTTTITSISGSGVTAGQRVTIIFDGALTFTDGSNLKLAGNFVTTADDSISLVYDGASWYEVGRSVN